MSGLRACAELGVDWGRVLVDAGTAALCQGTVWHRRNRPAVNEFTYRISQVWIDPDHPEELTRRHRTVVLIRSCPGSIPAIRLRTLSRRLDGRAGPRCRRTGARVSTDRSGTTAHTGAEVGLAVQPDLVCSCCGTTTPRIQSPRSPRSRTPRGRNALSIRSLSRGPEIEPGRRHSTRRCTSHLSSTRISATTSPSETSSPELGFGIAVLAKDSDEPIVETRVRVTRQDPTPAALGRALFHDALSTRRVSFGIHAQASPSRSQTRSIRRPPTTPQEPFTRAERLT